MKVVLLKTRKMSISVNLGKIWEKKIGVGTDVWGWSSTANFLGESNNNVISIVYFTSMSIFFENKSYMFDTFKRWKAVIENKTNLKVKCLIFDNRGEYRTNGFKSIAMKWDQCLEIFNKTMWLKGWTWPRLSMQGARGFM